MESSDIVLMKFDLEDVVRSYPLKQSYHPKYQARNLYWAFCFNSLGIPVAAGVLCTCLAAHLLNPVFGGLAMSFSSVFVVTNALRLKRVKL